VWIVTDRSTGGHTGLAEDNLGLRFAVARHAGVVTEYQLSTINH
jgi:hypothetical protein